MNPRQLLRPVIASVLLAIPALSQAGEAIRIAATVTPKVKIFAKVAEPFEKATGVQIILLPGKLGADAAFKEMDAGHADTASVASSLDDLRKLLKKEGYEPKNGEAYSYAILGKELLHLVAHPATHVKELTEAQFRDVLSGKVTNWKEVGGADVPVVLGASKDLPATNELLREKVLGAEAFSSAMKMQDDTVHLGDWVAATPGAAGWGPGSLVSAKVSSVKIPIVGRPIILISPGRPKESVAKFLKFMREEGTKLVP